MRTMLTRKQTHVSYNVKNKVSTSRFILLFHMELVGLMVRNLSGKKYIFMIIDDYS